MKAILLQPPMKVDKLALMLDSEKITLKQIIDLISDASTYSVYNLKDALYEGFRRTGNQNMQSAKKKTMWIRSLFVGC